MHTFKPIGRYSVIFVLAAFVSLNAQQGDDYSKQPSGSPAHQDISLPSSLDNLFPPNADQPVFQFMMLGMSMALSGTLVDLFENDMENALGNFEKFKKQYSEIPAMVPEWSDAFPIEPIDGLNDALATGDQQIIMSSFEQVGKVCHDCHSKYMVPVQQKYHWGDFTEISVEDPVQKVDVTFAELMQGLEMNFVGINIDLEQQQMENAFMHLQGFKARFETLEETCSACHIADRYYFVDQSVKSMIDQLEASMNKSPIDPNEVMMLGQKIGNESCFKCHLVHLPAAFAQHR
jgi:cytochrome c556